MITAPALHPKIRGTVEATNGVILVRFPYSPALTERIKTIPGRRWDKAHKAWLLPPTPDVIRRLRRLFPDFNYRLGDLEARCAASITASHAADADIEIPLPPGLELLPYQKAGVAYIEVKGGRAILGDEMGLGKSVQSLAWLNLRSELRPALVVCPALLKLNWQREAEKWLLPAPRVQVIQGGKDALNSSADMVIANYDLLTKLLPVFQGMRFRAVIMDESHYIKSQDSGRTKAALTILEKICHCLFLTGTPLLNRPEEGWTLFHAAAPEAFSRKWDYLMRYCNAHQDYWGRWDFSGASNLEELQEKLRATCMIRRLKKDVLPELPPKRSVLVPLAVSKKLQRAGAVAWEKVLEAAGGDAAKVIGVLRQQNNRALSDEVSELRLAAAREKLPQAVEFIKGILDSGEKVVVFAHHRGITGALHEAFRDAGAVVVRGGTPNVERQVAVDGFQTDPACRVFIGSLMAAATGITLTAASNVVFVEMDWTPGVMEQAGDRLHRIGQENAVTAWWLAADMVIEQRMVAMLAEKMEVIHRALDTEAAGPMFDKVEGVVFAGK